MFFLTTLPWHQGLMEVAGRYPSVWPILLIFLVVPSMALLEQPGMSNHLLVRNWRVLAVSFGVVAAGLFLVSDLANLFYPGFHENYESTGVSIGHVLFQGGPVYPELDSGECYSLPYGPVFYAVLGFSQWAFGGSTFTAKLLPALAPLLALGLLGVIVRGQGAGRSLMWVLVGLMSALLLAIRHASFWTKTDPLILLAVTVGIWLGLRRDERWSPVLGLCAGLAMGLKASALAYFLPVFVMAWLSGWRWRAFVLTGLGLAAAFFLPFLLFARQISLSNYFEFLQLVAREGFSPGFGLNYLRWALMLLGLMLVLDRCVTRQPAATHRRNHGLICYRLAILAGFIIIAVPGSVVGAGSNHHIPFIPLVLLACGPLIRPDGACIAWAGAVPLLWRSAACSILLACLLIAARHTGWIIRIGTADASLVKEVQADLRHLIRQYPDHIILIGPGTVSDCPQTRLRHELVIAGHPIGLDTAVVSDLQLGGGPEPRLGPLLSEINDRDPRPPLWIIPRGEAPFTCGNTYDLGRMVFPESFRRDFHSVFMLQRQTAWFDIYTVKIEDHVLATQNPRNPDRAVEPSL